jgi:hypothetical protein
MMDKQELFQKFDNDVTKRTRWYRFLLVLDQMGNVIFMNGSQDETISSHIARKQAVGTATKINNLVCYFLRKLQQNHCIRSEGE